MENIKITVLNGSKQIHKKFDDKWVVCHVTDEGGLKRGVYNLTKSSPAKFNKGNTYSGTVIYISHKAIYQDQNGTIIHHPIEMAPNKLKEGDLITISY